RHLPLSLGMVMVLASLLVLLAWIPLRQMPGLGTIANSLLLGPFADLNLAWLPTPDSLVIRVPYMLGGVLGCALATAMYIGAQLGPGPRDGLMTSLVRRTGRRPLLLLSRIAALRAPAAVPGWTACARSAWRSPATARSSGADRRWSGRRARGRRR